MKKISILIVDDHELILKGIRMMLKSCHDLEIIGEARNGQDALIKCLRLVPDIVFLDITMPGISGIEVCAQIVHQFPDSKVLGLSQHEDVEYVYQMLRAGCSGYMLKNSTREEFVEAIRSVMAGEKYFSRRVSEMMSSDLINRREKEDEKEYSAVHLTLREKEIIQLIADELSNQEISDRLHISLRTVETHRRNIMQKLEVRSVVSLIRYAIKHRIISLRSGD